jgi:hypothetical protein
MTSDRSPSPKDSHLSIVHQPSQSINPDQEPEYIEASITNIRPQISDAFLTPWGMGAIFIFLIANSLLSLNQWFAATNSVTSTSTTPKNSPLYNQQNTALNLDKLVKTAPNVQKTLKNSLITTIPAPPVVNNLPAPRNLTNALLPPNLPPPLMPAHQLPTRKIKQSLPVAVTSPQTPVSSLVSAPPPPPTITQSAPPAPSPAVMNEQMLEELRKREESPANLPFFQREKARRLADHNRQEATELMQQLPSQLQVQPSPSSQPLPAQPNPSQSPVPSSIIIDRSGTSVNY